MLIKKCKSLEKLIFSRWNVLSFAFFTKIIILRNNVFLFVCFAVSFDINHWTRNARWMTHTLTTEKTKRARKKKETHSWNTSQIARCHNLWQWVPFARKLSFISTFQNKDGGPSLCVSFALHTWMSVPTITLITYTYNPFSVFPSFSLIYFGSLLLYLVSSFLALWLLVLP